MSRTRARDVGHGWLHGVEVLLAIALLLAVVSPAVAQVREGATLTVLRGQVAVVRPDGSAIQPAPSGTSVNAGDEIRTLTATGALITFFAGTEIEMGPDTILVVDRVTQEGARVEVSLKQVLGTTISRVEALTDPTSAYRLEIGGAVSVVRGSTLAARGPETTPNGTFAAVACTGCSAQSYLEDLRTGERVPLGPQTFGYTWPVAPGGPTGTKDGAFEVFRVDLAAGLENAVAEAITTAEQAEQGDVRGVPAGQVASGRRQEARVEAERRDQAEQDEQDDNTAGATVPQPPVPQPPVPQPPVPQPPAPQPPAPQPRFNFTCTPIVPTGDRCVVTTSNLIGAQVGGTPQFSIQTLVGPTVQTETFACGTVSPALTAGCTVSTTGDIFQGGVAQFAYPLAAGGVRTLTVTTRCFTTVPAPPGTAC